MRHRTRLSPGCPRLRGVRRRPPPASPSRRDRPAVAVHLVPWRKANGLATASRTPVEGLGAGARTKKWRRSRPPWATPTPTVRSVTKDECRHGHPRVHAELPERSAALCHFGVDIGWLEMAVGTKMPQVSEWGLDHAQGPEWLEHLYMQVRPGSGRTVEEVAASLLIQPPKLLAQLDPLIRARHRPRGGGRAPRLGAGRGNPPSPWRRRPPLCPGRVATSPGSPMRSRSWPRAGSPTRR